MIGKAPAGPLPLHLSVTMRAIVQAVGDRLLVPVGTAVRSGDPTPTLAVGPDSADQRTARWQAASEFGPHD
jgi:hypothetical protein